MVQHGIPSSGDALADFNRKLADYYTAEIRTEARSTHLVDTLHAGMWLILSHIRDLGDAAPPNHAKTKTQDCVLHVISQVQAAANRENTAKFFGIMIQNEPQFTYRALFRAMFDIGEENEKVMKGFQTLLGTTLESLESPQSGLSGTLNSTVRFLCAIIISTLAANLLFEISATQAIQVLRTLRDQQEVPTFEDQIRRMFLYFTQRKE
jgi:hypothetical protein